MSNTARGALSGINRAAQSLIPVLESVNRRFEAITPTLDNVAKGAGKVAAATWGAAVAGTQAAGEWAHDIEELANMFGVAEERAEAFSKVTAKHSVDPAAASMAMMSITRVVNAATDPKNREYQAKRDLLKEIGLDPDHIRRKGEDSIAMTSRVLNAIGKLDSNKRLEVMSELGLSGRGMMKLFKLGDVEEQMAAATKSAGFLKASEIEELTAAHYAMVGASKAVGATWRLVWSEAAPALKQWFDLVARILQGVQQWVRQHEALVSWGVRLALVVGAVATGVAILAKGIVGLGGFFGLLQRALTISTAAWARWGAAAATAGAEATAAVAATEAAEVSEAAVRRITAVAGGGRARQLPLDLADAEGWAGIRAAQAARAARSAGGAAEVGTEVVAAGGILARIGGVFTRIMGAVSAVTGAIGSAVTWIMGVLEPVIAAVTSAVGWVVGGLTAIAEAVAVALGVSVGWAAAIIVAAFAAIAGAVYALWRYWYQIPGAISAAVTWCGHFAVAAKTHVVATLAAMGHAVITVGPLIWQHLVGAFYAATGSLARFAGEAWAFFTKALPVYLDHGYKAVVAWTFQTATAFVKWVENLPALLYDGFNAAILAVVDFGIRAGKVITDWATSTSTAISTWFKTLPARVYAYLSETLLAVWQWGKDTYTAGVDWAANTVLAVVDWFRSLPERLQEIFHRIRAGFVDWWHHLGGEFEKGEQKVTETLPHSEPKRGPLRGLGERGASIVKNIEAGYMGEIRRSSGGLADALSQALDFGRASNTGVRLGMSLRGVGATALEQLGYGVPSTPDLAGQQAAQAWRVTNALDKRRADFLTAPDASTRATGQLTTLGITVGLDKATLSKLASQRAARESLGTHLTDWVWETFAGAAALGQSPVGPSWGDMRATA